MRSRLLAGSVVLIAVLSLGACTDDVTAPTVSPSVSASITQLVAMGTGQDLPHIDRFSVAVEVDPRARLGQPLQVMATVHANLSTPRAQVAVQMPEVYLAQRDGWGRAVQAHAREVIPHALDRSASLAAGQSQEYVLPVSIHAPGIYRIVVTARADSAPIIDDGRIVHNDATTEAWLLATAAQVRLLSDFDPTAVPDSFAARPGPFVRARRLRRTSPTSGMAAGADQSIASATTVSTLSASYRAPTGEGERQVLYYDSDSSAYQPLAGANVHHVLMDQYAYQVEDEWDEKTDADGIYYARCGLAYFEEEQITVSTANGSIEVPGGGIYETETDDSGCYPGTSGGIFYSDADRSKLFLNLKSVVTGSQSLLGESRGIITASVSSTATRSFYSPSDDKITIRQSEIFGPWGAFTAAHEYGHAVQEKALGGIPSGGTCPNPHYLDGYYNLTCAYTEGFADFHGVATLPASRTNPYYGYFETDAYYTAGSDGSINESAVAAFFLDIIDPANESFDTIAYPSTYLGDVVKTCKNLYTLWTKANGVDAIVYCFERTVDPAVVSAYFVTRSPKPGGQSSSATIPASWNRTAIRTLWRHDLYGL